MRSSPIGKDSIIPEYWVAFSGYSARPALKPINRLKIQSPRFHAFPTDARPDFFEEWQFLRVHLYNPNLYVRFNRLVKSLAGQGLNLFFTAILQGKRFRRNAKKRA